MEIILVRHAIAMDRDVFKMKYKKDDSLRPLVMKGKRKMVKVAKGIQNFSPKADLIVTSPYLRARETAEIITRVYQGVKILEAAELVPAAPPEAFLNWLHGLRTKFKTIVVVGHEPQMSLFASYCLAGDLESFIDLKKSGAICLSIDSLSHLNSRTAHLKWLITPKMFGN